MSSLKRKIANISRLGIRLTRSGGASNYWLQNCAPTEKQWLGSLALYRRGSLRLLASAAVCLSFCSVAMSQDSDSSSDAQIGTALDRVVVGPSARKSPDREWKSNQVISLEGKIRQLDGAKLLMVTEDGKPASADSSRVESVGIQWATPAAVAAMKLFSERSYREAIPAIEAAVKSGDLPRWQQRFAISAMVHSIEAIGNPRTAGIVFLSLASSSPPALLYADAPLCWTTREPERIHRDTALQWLQSEDEMAKLLGASWLLLGTESERARGILLKLQSSENTTIAELALAQSWRATPPPRTLDELPKWIELRDKLIPPLQIGPTEFMAERLMRIGEPELAFGQWMRIASNHPDRYHRARLALAEAARLLQRDGHEDEAKVLMPWIESLGPKQ